MHSLTYHENNGFTANPMISINQSVPRNNSKLTRIRGCSRPAEATPGQAQVLHFATGSKGAHWRAAVVDCCWPVLSTTPNPELLPDD